MRRNGFIGLMKYFAALCIAMYHFEWLYIEQPVFLGLFYIWVEFFFVCSGFFVCLYHRDYTEKPLIDTIKASIKWLKKQLKKQYPLYGAACVFSVIVYCFTQNTMKLRVIINTVFSAKWELIMLVPFCNVNKVFNIVGPAYQIPITLVGGVVCMVMAKLLGKLHKIFFPVLTIILLSLIIIRYNNLGQWTTKIACIQTGIYRGIAEMMFGYWLVSTILPIVRNTRIISRRLCICVCTFAILALIVFRNTINHSALVVYVPVYGMLILTLYQTQLSNNLLNDIFLYMEKMSYPLFLFHGIVLTILSSRFGNYGYKMMGRYLVIINAMAFILTLVFQIMGHGNKYEKKKL